MSAPSVRPLAEADRPWASRLLAERWGSADIVTRGRVHRADRLPGFVASQDGRRLGLVTYRLEGADCELVSLDSLAEGQGIGTALLKAVEDEARAGGARRLWLVTTNDNLRAVEFYRRRGYRVAAVHRGAVVELRRLKPSIPLAGLDGIPIEDEIEMELVLGRSS
jgi:ribosomal protein S18 acetylase RimI-like enzyme